MAVGDIVIRKCKHCGDEFPHEVKGAGRFPDYCGKDKNSRAAQATANYRETEKYRKAYRARMQRKAEEYDPWKWENTILEWNE